MPHIILEVPQQFDTELAKKVINLAQQLKAKIRQLLNSEVNLDNYSVTLELMELSTAYAN